MRVRQITGTKLAAQIASKTRFGWYKTWLLAVTGWLILLTASAQSPDIVWMRGIHLGSVNSVVVSPDGTLVASASGDGTVKLWRMSDGLLVRVLRGHRRGATCVAFSPNGSLLASGGVTADNNLNDLYEIKLWRVSDGSEVRTLTGHRGVVTSVAFSPDGTLLASGGGYRDRTIRLWRVSDGALMRTLPGHAWDVTDIAFSPDGSLVASGSAYYDVSDRGDIKLWRVSDGSEVRHIRVDRAVSSIAFSPDGGLIASGNGDGTVKLWRVLDGVLVLTLTGHRRYVYSLAFSPDGNLLASGGWDGIINLWRMSDGLRMHTLTGHSGRVNSLAFSPDGTMLVSGGSDGIINSWRMSDGLKMHTLTGHNQQVNSLAFSPDGTLLASASGGIIKLWRVSDGSEVRTLSEALVVTSVAFSPDGTLLASASGGIIKLWRVSDGSEVRILRGHTSTVGCVAFSPDGSLIASGADDGIVILWSTSNGAQLINLRQRGSVFTVAFSSDSSTLASVSSSEIKFWRVPDGSEVRTISGSGTLSPDGSLVASGYNDGTIKLWRVSDGSEVRTFTGHRGAVTRVAFSPDGTLLASASTDRTIKLWRLPSGDLLQNYDQVTSATSIHFSPDGQLFVYADSDALVMARSPFVSSNRPPAIPGLIQPEDGATVSQTPTFRVGLSDPDGDQVKAIIEISDASGVVRTLETSLVASGSEASVSVAAEQPLAAGSYTWRARAQDSNGLQSDWSAARAFTVSAANQPPAVPTLVAPSDNATVSQTPTFRVGLSDPDGDQVKVIIEISDASGVVRTLETSLVASGSEASVSVAAEQPLAAGSYTWRARAQDSNGLQSDWSAARAFTVSTANQPPAVPTLVAPSDNATVSQTPTFRVGLSDPDGDQVKAIIEISDASGVVRTLETSLVASGSEASVSVAAEQPLAAGSYTWRARAQDSSGNLSDWSVARALIVAEGVPILLQGVRTFALIGAGVSSPDSLGLDGVELVRWDASAQRYSRVSQLQPGEGYFVKATTPVQTFLRGDPIIGEFTLQLRPGWNLIAIPTLTAVAWDLDGVQVQRGGERKSLREAQRAGWVEDYLWGWQQSADDPMSGQYQLVYDARILPVPGSPDPTSHEHPVYGFASVLKPFQAYWIFARESCALVLNSERGRAAAVAPVSDSSAWVLQIEAVRGSGVSNSVWIGIAKGRSWHAALAPAPPQGEPPVQVRVRRQEGSFAADLRSAMDRDTRWHIEVVVAPSEQPQPITLRVNNLTRLPRGVNLALIDEQSGARRPLRMAASSLSFTAPAEGGVFRFAIEPISQRALLRVLNPTVRGGSRSGEAITLGFTLTTEAQTQVQIRAGSRTVRTLSDHRTRSAGLQEFVWDGRDDSGTHLPPGAYTAEITAISSDGQTARVAVPILIRR